MPHFKFMVVCLFMAGITSCNKLATLTVHVTRNVNGIEQPVPDVLVMTQNLPECKDIEGENTNANGIAVFDLKNGSYRVVAQTDSLGAPVYTELSGGIQLTKGKSREVTFVLP